MLVDVEAFLFEACAKEAGEAAIVETASAEGDVGDAGLNAGVSDGIDQSLDEIRVKLSCDLRGLYAGAQVVKDSVPKLVRFQESDIRATLFFPKLEKIALTRGAVEGVMREAFEFNGGLCFVVNLAAAEDESGDGVEEAAAA